MKSKTGVKVNEVQEMIYLESSIEPIIPKEVFYQVQELLDKRGKKIS